MSDTPETEEVAGDGWSGDAECVPADFARRLERERDEARRIAEAYRKVWEICSNAVDTTPNWDPLPWKRK